MASQIKYNCIFGGGGVRGMAYIGALRALNELGIELNAIAGSSVGAVFASLLAVGYDENEIKELFFDFNFNMFRDININIFNTDISLSKGEIFLDWLRETIGKKIYGENYNQTSKIRFKDIKKDLYILTLDLNTNTPFIFSKETTPDEEIAFAVRTSACLPGLMKPINIGESRLVDGDLIKSWAGWKIFDALNTSENRLLEFRLEGTKDGSDFKNPMDYLNSVISTIWYLCTENVYNSNYENDRYDYIVVDTKDLILFDFTIEKEKKEEIAEQGYYVTKNYFLDTLVKKKKVILPKYVSLLEKTNELIKNIDKNDADTSLFIINDILSTMVEDIKHIDISIYKKLNDFKNSLVVNIKKQFISKKIENANQLKERVIFIKLLIQERIDEINLYLKKVSNIS